MHWLMGGTDIPHVDIIVKGPRLNKSTAFATQILLCPIPALLTKKFSPELAKQVPERGAIQTLGIKVNIYKVCIVRFVLYSSKTG